MKDEEIHHAVFLYWRSAVEAGETYKLCGYSST